MARFGAQLVAEELVPNDFDRYNVCPTQSMPVVLGGERGNQLARMQWGLVPSWARESTGGARLINARSEGVAETPSFRGPFRRRRCLVPASEFYEWLRVGKERRPQRIHPVREGLFAMAGLWDEWRGADPPLRTFTIITTDANQTLAPLHHRMPVILHPADEAVWLDPGAPVDALAALLRPCPEPFLAYYPITDRINRVDSEGPECIAPPRAQEPLQPTLF